MNRNDKIDGFSVRNLFCSRCLKSHQFKVDWGDFVNFEDEVWVTFRAEEGLCKKWVAVRVSKKDWKDICIKHDKVELLREL